MRVKNQYTTGIFSLTMRYIKQFAHLGYLVCE